MREIFLNPFPFTCYACYEQSKTPRHPFIHRHCCVATISLKRTSNRLFFIVATRYYKIHSATSYMDEDDMEAYEEFVDSFGNDSFDSFKERYMGKWDSEKDFAEHIVDECYNLDDMMGHLASYFDYDAYARDLFIDDYYFTDGYVFRR